MAAPVIAVPSVSVVGQGSCTFAPVQPVSGVDGDGSSVELYPYSFQATPAAGWNFVRFDGYYTRNVIDNSSGVETPGTEVAFDVTVNPFTLRADYSGASVIGWWGASWLGLLDQGPTAYTYYTASYRIVAVFEQGPHVPTDLLVYDDASGLLVYDDISTGKLVADF